MYTNNTITRAEKIMNDYLEVIGAPMPSAKVYEAVYAQYCNSDITDPYMLAAMAMRFGNDTPVMTIKSIINITGEYFPEVIYGMGNEISIEEIEQAERDYIWQ